MLPVFLDCFAINIGAGTWLSPRSSGLRFCHYFSRGVVSSLPRHAPIVFIHCSFSTPLRGLMGQNECAAAALCCAVLLSLLPARGVFSGLLKGPRVHCWLNPALHTFLRSHSFSSLYLVHINLSLSDVFTISEICSPSLPNPTCNIHSSSLKSWGNLCNNAFQPLFK